MPSLSGQCRTLKSRATAMPSAAEMDVEECPAPKGSYSLSARFVNPAEAPALLTCQNPSFTQQHAPMLCTP